MAHKILGIIPARYASQRFPAKPLVDILGKTMIQRVYEQCTKSKLLDQVVVATDHPLIYDHVLRFGGHAVMTSPAHLSGTDRCCEAYTLLRSDAKFIINIQGDEPLISPDQIDLLALSLHDNTQIATLAIQVKSLDELKSNTTAKIVLNVHNEALYFSRSPIPFIRNISEENWLASHTFWRHIGIYAYKNNVLEAITQLKPTTLELAESLEQLRWLQNGYRIQVQPTPIDSHSVDVPADLDKIISLLQ